MKEFETVLNMLDEDRQEQLLEVMVSGLSTAELQTVVLTLLDDQRQHEERVAEFERRIEYLEKRLEEPSPLTKIWESIARFTLKDWAAAIHSPAVLDNLSVADRGQIMDLFDKIRGDKQTEALIALRRYSNLGVQECKLLIELLRTEQNRVTDAEVIRRVPGFGLGKTVHSEEVAQALSPEARERLGERFE